MIWTWLTAAATLFLDLLTKHLATLHLGSGDVTAVSGLLTVVGASVC